MTTSDNEWQRVVQQVTTSGATSDNEWQRVVVSDSSNDSKNKWLFLSVTFTAKPELAFILTFENAFS